MKIFFLYVALTLLALGCAGVILWIWENRDNGITEATQPTMPQEWSVAAVSPEKNTLVGLRWEDDPAIKETHITVTGDCTVLQIGENIRIDTVTGEVTLATDTNLSDASKEFYQAVQSILQRSKQ